MSEILVSVITPCYNSAKTIERTLDCMSEQTYQNVEYIIVDGGSTDETLQIIEEYRAKLPKRLIVVSEKDNGIYDAMNKGIRKASGQLIGIVNSDDWYERDTIETIVANYQKNPYEVVYGMLRTIENGRQKAVFMYSHEFLPQQMITHPTCFVTKACYDKFGVFDCQYRSAADYDLMLRFYQSKEVVFTPVTKILSNFQTGGASSGQLGVRENILLQYRYGYVSKKRYLFVKIKSHIYEWLKG